MVTFLLPLPASRGRISQPKFNALKKSLPLSSTTMKAGKFSTSMRQIASMDVTPDGNPVLANSLVNQIGLVEVK